MRRSSKFALLLAPFILATSVGCSTSGRTLGFSSKPAVEVDRSNRMMEIASRYEKEGKHELAYRIYSHIASQDPDNTTAVEHTELLAQKMSKGPIPRKPAAKEAEPKTAETLVAEAPKTFRKEKPAVTKAPVPTPKAAPATSTTGDSAELIAALNKARVQKNNDAELAAVAPPKTISEPEAYAPPEADNFSWAEEKSIPQLDIAASDRQVASVEPVADDFADLHEGQLPTITPRSAKERSPAVWLEADLTPETAAETATTTEPQVAQTEKTSDWWDDVFTAETAPAESNTELAAAELTSEAPAIEPEVSSEWGWEPVIKPAVEKSPVKSAKMEWRPTSLAHLCPDLPESLEPQIRLLDGQRAEERIAGLTELGELKTEAQPVVAAIRMLLDDEDQLVQAHAAGALIQIEGAGEDSYKKFEELLASDNDAAIQMSAYILGRIGFDAIRTAPKLQEIRDAERGVTSLYAAEALVRIVPEDEASFESLQRALFGSAAEERWFAAVSLGTTDARYEAKAAKALKEALRDDATHIRAAAALSLGGLGNNAKIALLDLHHVAANDEAEVRDAALVALACLE